MIHPNYPSSQEIDQWCEEILARAEARRSEPRFVEGERYPFALGVRGISRGDSFISFPSAAPFGGATEFYCYWQPAPAGPAPILFHLPGYGGEMSAHPELVAAGFNVLHINPLGYATPQGPVNQTGAIWPVLPETVSSFGERGYIDWLTDAAVAIQWALQQPSVLADRFGFFGTSQGGGTSLLLGSIFSRKGCRAVAADVPFLTNFPMAEDPKVSEAPFSAYALAFNPLKGLPEEQRPRAWRALGFVDTLSHVHRLTMPVLLTAGTVDGTCPACTIESLFEKLPGTRSYTSLYQEGHAYTTPFHFLTAAWARIYV